MHVHAHTHTLPDRNPRLRLLSGQAREALREKERFCGLLYMGDKTNTYVKRPHTVYTEDTHMHNHAHTHTHTLQKAGMTKITSALLLPPLDL